MASELLDVHPRDLKFLYELKKMSSCTVRLVNKFDDLVAFKVKTTSPKKYSVRPNVGIIKPKSYCDLTVMMQAPKVECPDIICKDKFLVQSTVVPAGTTDDDITSSMFRRDDDKYIEEVKLRVILLIPPDSPILSPINAILQQDPLRESSILKDNIILKRGSFTQKNQVSDDRVETKVDDGEMVKPVEVFKSKTMKEMEDLAKHANYESMKSSEDPLKHGVYKPVKREENAMKNVDYKTADHLQNEELSKNGDYKTLDHLKDEEGPKENEDYDTLDHVNGEGNAKKQYKTLNYAKDEVDPTKDSELKQTAKAEAEVAVRDLHRNTVNDIDEKKLVKDVDEMKKKLGFLENKLTEAEVTISKLTEERRWTGQERESLKQDLAMLRSKRGERMVQTGYPFLFVCMVAIVGVLVGYTLRC